MQMNVIKICFICSLCVFFTSPLLAFYSIAQDTTQADTVRQVQPDYVNVNVLIETEWGTSDKHENVDVRLNWSGKKVTEVVIINKYSECSIILIEGVVVKIIDPKSGKVIKRFK